MQTTAQRTEATRRWRARKRGDLAPWQTLSADLPSHGQRVGDCLFWTHSRTVRGYGHVWIDGRLVYVHRLALETKLGRPLAPGMESLHTCDAPSCFEPAHLFEGTQGDNMRDMRAKGRDRHWGNPHADRD